MFIVLSFSCFVLISKNIGLCKFLFTPSFLPLLVFYIFVKVRNLKSTLPLQVLFFVSFPCFCITKINKFHLKLLNFWF